MATQRGFTDFTLGPFSKYVIDHPSQPILTRRSPRPYETVFHALAKQFNSNFKTVSNQNGNFKRDFVINTEKETCRSGNHIPGFEEDFGKIKFDRFVFVVLVDILYVEGWLCLNFKNNEGLTGLDILIKRQMNEENHGRPLMMKPDDFAEFISHLKVIGCESSNDSASY